MLRILLHNAYHHSISQQFSKSILAPDICPLSPLLFQSTTAASEEEEEPEKKKGGGCGGCFFF